MLTERFEIMEREFYLFDFDGVLVDSMEFWAGLHMQTLRSAGIPIPEDFVETITPLGNYNAAKHTLSLGVDLPLDAYLEDIYKTLFEAYTTHITIKENVKQTLLRLKEQGISIHVLTASPHLYVDPCLQRNGIFELFENVWTIDDFGLTKAQPEIYQQAAERLGAKVENCTMFDDNLTAITTAKEAGLKTIAVYDSTSKSSEAAMRQIADRYIYNFSKI